MIARASVMVLTVLAAAVLQTALFPSLTLLGFRPDLLLLLVLALALREGATVGVLAGAVTGLLTDLLVAQAPVGLGMLVFAVIGYAAGQARPYLAPSSVSAPLLLAFVTGALGTAAYGGLSSLLGDDRATTLLLAQASFAVGLYNMLLAPLVFAGVGRLIERFPSRASDRPE